MRRTLSLVLAAMAVQLAGQAQAPVRGKLTVRTVEAGTNAPLPGVQVIGYCFGGVGEVRQYQGATDTSGELSSAVPPGECGIEVAQLRGYSRESSGRRYEVAAGETVDVALRFQRRPSVSGTIFDEQHAPIAGVKVFIQRRVIVVGAPVWWNERNAFVVTDEHGRFSDTTVAAGIPYRLDVPSVELAAPAGEFVLKAGESRVVSLGGRKLPVFNLSGHVRQPGVNLGFVTVSLERADSTPGRPITVADARAEASGAFTFRQIPKGAYRIRVDTGASTVTNYSPSDILTAWQPITIDRDIEDVAVPLIPGNEVSGRVRFEGATPPPSSFVGVGIQFAAANGREPRPLLSSARGTVGTNFWTRALAPDKYLVTGHSLAGDWRLKSAMFNGEDATDVPFDSSLGRVADIVVTLTDRHTEIRGTVRDATGKEAPEATVAIYSTDSRFWTNPGGRRVKLWDATQRGRFFVRDMPPGEYFVAALASAEVPFEGSTPDVEWLRRLSATASRMDLKEDVPAVLTLMLR